MVLWNSLAARGMFTRCIPITLTEWKLMCLMKGAISRPVLPAEEAISKGAQQHIIITNSRSELTDIFLAQFHETSKPRKTVPRLPQSLASERVEDHINPFTIRHALDTSSKG